MGEKRVAIIGGGITGLTLCETLSSRGCSVHLFESKPFAGGLAATVQWDDFFFDYGPHEFCTGSNILINYLKDVLGSDYLLRDRRACQFFMGAEISYPFTFTELIKCVGFALPLRTAMEVIAGRIKNIFWQQEDFSFRKWTESRYGKTLYADYFEPYTKKVWGIDPDRLDPRTASKRISFNSIFDYVYQYLMLRLKNEASKNPHSPMRNQFIYANKGIGTLCRRLMERAAASGAEIHLDSPVSGFHMEQNKIGGIEIRGELFSDFDLVVSTLPLSVLLDMLGYRMPQLIRYRSIAFVFLKVPIEQMRDWQWIYFPDPDIVFQRLAEFSRFDAHLCPDGQTGLCAEISYFPEDEIGGMTDDELVARTVGDLKRSGFLPDAIECEGMVHRTDFGYPVQINGYIEWVTMMLAPIAEISNLLTTGRQGLYKYCNMNECMEMAFEMADNIMSGNPAREYSPDSRWKGAGAK